jgi:heterotetrameric sarcosine oxidase gamma subunit
VNLDFLKVDAAVSAATGVAEGGPIARSPMEACARAAGARFEVRHGWNVAVGFGGASGQEAAAASGQEAAAALQAAGWADVSDLGKLEIQAPAASLEAIGDRFGAALELGVAARAGDAWWCRLTTTRALVIGDSGVVLERLEAAVAQAPGATLLDVGTNFAAITIVGPLAREVLARFCALDLRPARTPVGALRPGSIGRQPGILICEAENRYLLLFGWATGEYVWSIVTDAGRHLGGRPIGADALAGLSAPSAITEEESVSA